MKIKIVNANNEPVGDFELSDALFGGRVKRDLIRESVVQQNAAERRGTHATKTRAMVSGSGKKPWRQKGTGRARVGEIRNPLWRKGGTTFGPQPRSYEFDLPKKVRRGALIRRWRRRPGRRAGDRRKLEASEKKDQGDRALLKQLGATGKTLIIDVTRQDDFALTPAISPACPWWPATG